MPKKYPENVLDQDLYDKARKIADKTFKRHGVYKSMFLVTTYKKLGGRYKGNKQSYTKKWLKEEWVQVVPYLNKTISVSCGNSNKVYKVCRPLIRIDKTTPITLPELLETHSEKELLELAKKKEKDMNGRVFWKRMKFYPSK